MKNLSRWMSLLLAVGLIALTSGCAALVVGGAAGAVGSVAYVRGELKATVESPLEKTWKATQESMRDLEFVVTLSEKDALEARVEAEGVAKTIKVVLKELGPKTTDVRIRVGVFGDEAISRRVLDTIKRNL